MSDLKRQEIDCLENYVVALGIRGYHRWMEKWVRIYPGMPPEKIMEINVPVVNIGTFGRDGHMLTERVDMQQTFQNVPNITYETILGLIG